MKFQITQNGRRIASPKSQKQGLLILALFAAEFAAEGVPCPEYQLSCDGKTVKRIGGAS